jgi:hypothetical protein
MRDTLYGVDGERFRVFEKWAVSAERIIAAHGMRGEVTVQGKLRTLGVSAGLGACRVCGVCEVQCAGCRCYALHGCWDGE